MKRVISKKIEEAFQISRVVILVGQRQVGKTYEMKRFLEEQAKDEKSHFIDFEDQFQNQNIEPSLDRLESIFGDKAEKKFLFFDEIQYVKNIGSILKILHDHFPNTSVLASGSASFLLLKDIGDSLYGRNIVLEMFPLMMNEILFSKEKIPDYSSYSFASSAQEKFAPFWKGNRESFLQYGTLPKIYQTAGTEWKEMLLKNYASSLLFKDIFEIEGIRNPLVFQKLLRLLALQIGSEVNPNELARQLEISRKTVLEYISLYEKFYIIKTLRSYSKKSRNEIKKGFKVFFYDLGIRNAVINDFSLPEYRLDKGALFENFVIMQLYQFFQTVAPHLECFYWRNSQGAEVDLVVVNTKTKKITPCEIKYSKNTPVSKAFMNVYEDDIENSYTINFNNFISFLGE